MNVNPYPGLRPFLESDAEYFFGRESQVEDLLMRLGRQRFLAVTGSSGCGKTSLIRAGLLPALQAGSLARPDRVALCSAETWRVSC